VLCVARLTNEGLAAARNHALDHVDTEWILFIDADVLPDDAFLARLTDVLNGSQADGVGFNVREHHRQSDWNFIERVNEMSLIMYRVGPSGSAAFFAPIGPTRYAQSMASTLLSAQMVHYRKDSIGSFLRMRYRYAFTAKRLIARSTFLRRKLAARRRCFDCDQSGHRSG